MKKPVVLSLGEVLWDLFPDGERFGGAPANFACHASILGAHASMVSAVGDDSHGREAIEILQSHGVDVDLVQVIPDARTGEVSVVLDAAGKPTYTIHENAAWDRRVWDAALETRAASADAVYFGTLGQRSPIARATIRRCVERARDAGVPRILDVNLRAPFYDAELIRDSVQRASLLKLSDEELHEVCQACGVSTVGPADSLMQRLLETQRLDLVVMTRGAEGAILATPDEIIEQPGIPTIVRDTVGAGDAFTAAFLLGRLQNVPHAENLLNACSVAALVCAHAGAVPARSDSTRPGE